ncbi:MAG TPA: nitroreductase family deazaflavin-dependent oxidoreductase [Solirubrobacteraceae bacterium]|jgi:deazaflavin-dependent oxidoreductase (nitroreductase family)|nr:nitroreductase family deazaflavin-dependent oxidoreductase [Solirubrobacteraceae bacterium]
MSTPVDFNAQVIDEFRANGGQVGGMLAGMPVLLLHHTGAQSGKEYVNPLAYLEDDGRYVIFASAAGAPKHPGWCHNLKANPDVRIEVGTQTLDVHAQEATGSERDRLYAIQSQQIPQFAEYEQKTDRVFPVIVLQPVGSS